MSGTSQRLDDPDQPRLGLVIDHHHRHPGLAELLDGSQADALQAAHDDVAGPAPNGDPVHPGIVSHQHFRPVAPVFPADAGQRPSVGRAGLSGRAARSIGLASLCRPWRPDLVFPSKGIPVRPFVYTQTLGYPEETMEEHTENLPLLPLTSGVVLPGMVFTMALESDEAKAATEAAEAVGGHFVIVPFIDGRYASVGVVAEVVETGALPGGMPAVAVRGVDRARLGTAVPGTGQALWVEIERITEDPATDETSELAREYRAVVENILLGRGAGRLAEGLAR